MKEKMIMMIIGMMLKKLNSEDIKRWMDSGLDMLEEKIKASPNQYDDAICLPLIATMRMAFSIPDND